MLPTVFLSVVFAVFSALTVYVLMLAVAYFALPARVGSAAAAGRRRFAVVVPAHDEEEGVAATVRSLLDVAWPEKLREVVVVADNCTDRTAEAARDSGARVLERVDAVHRGKGYALSYAFDALLKEPFDAFVVVDADSEVNRELLSAFDARLSAGSRVVQAYDGIANPDASFVTYVFAVGNTIENKLFYEPKSRMGLPALLRGNGMCFSRDVLTRFPWAAHSVAEDTEYSVRLLRGRVPVEFAPDARVLARQPETLLQAKDQRIRWASGNLRLSRSHSLRLLWEGIRDGNLLLADAGATLLVQSKPLMLLGSMLVFAAGVCVWRMGAGGPAWAVWGGLLLAAHVLYLSLGVAMEGFRGNRMRHLLMSPFMVAWFFAVSLLGVIGYRGGEWVRTRRD